MAAIEGIGETNASGPVYQMKENLVNPCKILEPARKTIETIEGQRLMAVLDDTIHRLELVMALQQVIQQLPRFKVMLGSDLVELLESHDSRQNHYQKTAARLQKENLKMTFAISPPLIDTGNHSDSQSEGELPVEVHVDVESSEEWKMLKKDTIIAQQGLKYSLLDILRYFKKNPKAVELILDLKLPCAPAYRSFLDHMDLLQTVVKEKLLTQPAEEIKRKKSIVDVLKRERRTNAAKQKLETKYEDALKDKNDEISKRDVIIAQLKSELSMLYKVTHEQQRRTLADAVKQCNMDTKISEGKKVKMRDDMLTRIRGLRDDRRENRDNETVMRKRTFKIGTEVFNWVQKYDADMGARQDELDRIQRIYEAEREDLSELENEFKIIEAKYEAILEEKRQAIEAAKKREEEIAKINSAARMIQIAWRNYVFTKGQNKKAQKKTAKKGKKKTKKL